ncbi:hypothetical protein H5410_026629 [Solanum commersonii]|uniref:Uncharacterized protein n=1 Tax=Solanum commersonii TaxID=4109 RepID=A0A9J5YX31_SOLCO|nr:hypothetical protein H5410_026629 [Solanum commersonii]
MCLSLPQWENISPNSSLCSYALGDASLAKYCHELFDTGSPLFGYYSGQGLFGLCIDNGYRARVHKGHRYAFGGLNTRTCRAAGVPKENVDYMAPLFPAPVDITRTKGPDTEFVPTFTTAERHRRDELIMARMYGLEILCHQNGCLASTNMQLGDVERRYPLNAHAKALLGIGPEFHEPVDNDISTNEE